MRIAIVEPMGSGGLIHYAYQLGEALSRQGAEVTLLTAQEYELEALPHTLNLVKLFHLWSRHDAIITKQFQVGRLRRIILGIYRKLRRFSRGYMLVREWVRLTHYLLQERPDIIQFGKINFLFEALFLELLNRRGLILTDICHEFELREQAGNWFGRLATRLYPSTFRSFSMVFLHAEANRRDFLRNSPLTPDKTCVIPMGNQQMFMPPSSQSVNTEIVLRRYDLTPSTPLVLFFGNLTYSKGLSELVEAFALLPKDSGAKLLIAGYPTKFMNLAGLKRRVTHLELDERVIFDLRYIPMEEVPGLMSIARVVAFPYRNSSQSGSLQMAYSFGKAVIATRVGGLPEVVDHERSGLLVDQGSIEDLAEAMQRLIDDPKLAQRMGAYARELSETRFSWDAIAKQVIAQYEQLIQ
jgi:glycosyltransferase involved in cell wall biosynthesis